VADQLEGFNRGQHAAVHLGRDARRGLGVKLVALGKVGLLVEAMDAGLDPRVQQVAGLDEHNTLKFADGSTRSRRGTRPESGIAPPARKADRGEHEQKGRRRGDAPVVQQVLAVSAPAEPSGGV
jgi:hypothetical protein